ncbi:MAG: hypothetical protein ACRDJH_12750 [Thermomicrobiales bacterium]
MNLGKRLAVLIGIAALFGVVAYGGGPRLLAQEASPAAEVAGHPIHIHSGSCGDNLGEVVVPLTDVTDPAGDVVGQATGIVAATSFTTVPLALDAILAEPHAINAHESATNIGNYIACGDLGGVLNDQGALVVGLGEQNDSGFSGIAFLVPNAADPTQTDISVFLAEGLFGTGIS